MNTLNKIDAIVWRVSQGIEEHDTWLHIDIKDDIIVMIIDLAQINIYK